ncbi:SDR family NAD(P)-dependent oxidoreductase [Streptomyces sp. NPDC006923]|uniref:SDR family NAD(P)-dependent oxidoreductase n=1 Tax=Streptomyces sp. NPDC006923 TaxID=3155355 RepID=UPI0033E07DAB
MEEPSPHVDWESGAVELLTEEREWPEVDRPRRAAVSSFGFGGTNAHVIVEEAGPEPVTGDVTENTTGGVVPWLLSARTPEALSSQARRLLAMAEARGELSGPDVAYSLATTRARFGHGAAVVGGDREALLDGLRSLVEGRPGPGVVSGVRSPGRTAFLFSGQGAQRAGMGHELYASYPVFADALDAVCAAFDPHLPRPLKSVMFAAEGSAEAALLEETGFTQPALFAFEVALFRLLESWGVTPDVVAGHSVGELTAAHVSGILTLSDGVRLVAARAGLMQALPRGGAMVAVQAAEQEVAPLLAGRAGEVAVAAVNGPSVVVSGDEAAVAEIAGHFAALGRRTSRLAVSHAFHSPHMDGMLEDFRTAAKEVTFGAADIPVVSTLTGQVASGDDLRTADYWVDQVRHAVRFADAARTLEAEGVTTLLEVGPGGVLSALVAGAVEQPDTTVAVPAVRGRRPEPEELVAALSALHCRGVVADWQAFFAGTGARRVELPTYAFQHQPYWLRPEVTGSAPAEDALFRVVWAPATVPAPEEPPHWAVLAPADRTTEALPGADRFPDVAGIARAVASGTRIDAVLLPFPPDLPSERAVEGPHRALALVREWLAEERLAEVRLVVLTSGAVAVSEGDDLTDLGGAAAWGLVRSAQSEAPGRIVLVDAHSVTDEALSAVAVGSEPQTAVRKGSVFTPGLTAVRGAGGDGPVWDPEGTVLITGGTGALGGVFARHLVAGHGVRHVLLVSRQGERSPGAGTLTDELTGLGATVTVAACDVSDREALAALLARIPEEHPLTGVVHTAGVLDNGLLPAQDTERLDRVLRPKADAAWHLHELTKDLDLTAFVLFSSTAGVFGAPGQSNYAAANAFLDALARHRAARGLPATSLAWGLWGSRGINAGLTERDMTRFARDGFRPVTEDEGRTLFDRGLASGVAALVASPVISPAVTTGARAAGTGEDTSARTAGEPALSERLAGLSQAEREEYLLRTVTTTVAAVLGHRSPAGIAPDRPFQELGFDSLTGVELRNRLGAATGVRLPATLVFDHPNPAALAAYLLAEAAPETVDPARSVHEELDRIEASLAELPQDDEARSGISVRLQTLLAKVTAPVDTTDTAPRQDLIDSASTDEIFAFIDTQLGRAAG